jgi:hypothetical protein
MRLNRWIPPRIRSSATNASPRLTRWPKSRHCAPKAGYAFTTVGSFANTSTRVPAAGFFPEGGDVRWGSPARQALGDGIIDAALLARYEFSTRPPEKQWQNWADARKLKKGCRLAAGD